MKSAKKGAGRPSLSDILDLSGKHDPPFSIGLRSETLCNPNPKA